MQNTLGKTLRAKRAYTGRIYKSPDEKERYMIVSISRRGQSNSELTRKNLIGCTRLVVPTAEHLGDIEVTDQEAQRRITADHLIQLSAHRKIPGVSALDPYRLNVA